MSSYNEFAKIYDALTSDVDYDSFLDYILAIFKKNQLDPKLILELACGTGNILKKLADLNYDVIGIDNSEAMLNVAAKKCEEQKNVLLLNQDMTDFELYGTVDAIICLLDSVNYILDKRKFKKMLNLVKNYLNPEGLFIFDINSEYKLKNIIGNNTFVYDTDDVFYTWENFREKNICNFLLTFFTLEDGKYKRIDEQHLERIYLSSEIEQMIAKSGLKLQNIYGDFTFYKPKEKSQRLFFIVKK